MARKKKSEPDVQEMITAAATEVDGGSTDVYVCNAPMVSQVADMVTDCIDGVEKRREKAMLVLTTEGGDPGAAFRIARHLQRTYNGFTLFVVGWCKSAGTLAAIGAREIVMTPRAELGPLDVQVSRDDELVGWNSGLDLVQALALLSSQTLEAFESFLVRIVEDSQGAITTKTAAEIASGMAVGLITPIAAQIEPARLGYLNRALSVAQEYGDRLCKMSGRTINNDLKQAITQLTAGYSTHSFVIDREEAEDLFGFVRDPHEPEAALERILRPMMRWPSKSGPIVRCLNPLAPPTHEETPDHLRSGGDSTPPSEGSNGKGPSDDAANGSAESRGEADAPAQKPRRSGRAKA